MAVDNVNQPKIERLTELKEEFQRLLDFHSSSFTEIDAKAKYWLTLTLPSFVALMGFLLQQWEGLQPALIVSASALLACLFVSTILFAGVLRSRPVSSGVLVPQNRSINEVTWYLEEESLDLLRKSGEHQLNGQEVFNVPWKQTDAGISA